MIVETIREQGAKTIRHITPIPYDSAEGLTGEVYHQMQTDFLPTPPLTLHSPAPIIKTV